MLSLLPMVLHAGITLGRLKTQFHRFGMDSRFLLNLPDGVYVFCWMAYLESTIFEEQEHMILASGAKAAASF